MGAATRAETGRARLGRTGLVQTVTTASAFMPAIATFAVVTAVGIAGGGFHPRSWRLGMAALLAFGIATLLARETLVLRRREWLLMGALAGLAAWSALSSFWSLDASKSILEAER